VYGSSHARTKAQVGIGAVDHCLYVGLLDNVTNDDFDLHDFLSFDEEIMNVRRLRA
jgi:hypothetical protein